MVELVVSVQAATGASELAEISPDGMAVPRQFVVPLWFGA
jgi:hypothetical protein